MINGNLENLIRPARHVKGKVEILGESPLTITADDKLVSFTVDRACSAGKFFGCGVGQKATIKLNDKDKELNLTKGQSLKLYISIEGEEYVDNMPTFTIDEITRNENTNGITLTAYDLLQDAQAHQIKDLTVVSPMAETQSTKAVNVISYINAIKLFYGNECVLDGIPADDYNLNYVYQNGLNASGRESIRDMIEDISEVLGAIYYINPQDNIVFKRLKSDGAPVYSVAKNSYFTLKSESVKKIEAICKANALGDNVQLGEGLSQKVMDNMFWDNYPVEQLTDALTPALAAVQGLEIAEVDCKWRGNHYLEIGDKISFVGKNDQIITTFLLKDTLTYSGSLSETTSWEYGSDNSPDHSNPVSLGAQLKNTTAIVDKVNDEVIIVAGKAENNENKIAQLKLTTDNLSTQVLETKTIVSENIGNQNEAINKLQTDMSKFTQTSNQAFLEFKTDIEQNGVDKITTSTGFTFNQDGLNITKDNSPISTRISEDGMEVSNNGSVVLDADNRGVQAVNLHASTYLIIGRYSRLEDYRGRTGCFWIGG